MRIIYLFFLGILFSACSSENTDRFSQSSYPIEDPLNPFPDFENFPTTQYRSIELGKPTREILEAINAMNAEKRPASEVIQFFLPEDSTEVIIPDQDEVSEFKLFLRSQRYLSNELAFRSFLEEKASVVMKHPTFQIFQFKSDNIFFEMSYFRQDDYIRLHFTEILVHS